MGIRSTGALATAAAVSATIGDFLLLHVAMTADAAEATLLVGYYLGVLALPVYGVGYWQVSRGLGGTRPARVVFVLGALAGAIGAAVHAVTGLAIGIVPAPASAPLDPISALGPAAAYLLPLWALLGVLALGGSAVQVVLVLRGSTAYPRWFALVNPVLLVVAVVLAALPFPGAARYLVPAAPNLVHVPYFGLSTLLLWRQRR